MGFRFHKRILSILTTTTGVVGTVGFFNTQSQQRPPHLRHEFATKRLANGVTLKDTSELISNQDISWIPSNYSQPNVVGRKNILELMDWLSHLPTVYPAMRHTNFPLKYFI